MPFFEYFRTGHRLPETPSASLNEWLKSHWTVSANRVQFIIGSFVCAFYEAVTALYHAGLRTGSTVDEKTVWMASCGLVGVAVAFAAWLSFTVIMASSFILYGILHYAAIIVGLLGLALGAAGALHFSKEMEPTKPGEGSVGDSDRHQYRKRDYTEHTGDHYDWLIVLSFSFCLSKCVRCFSVVLFLICSWKLTITPFPFWPTVCNLNPNDGNFICTRCDDIFSQHAYWWRHAHVYVIQVLSPNSIMLTFWRCPWQVPHGSTMLSPLISPWCRWLLRVLSWTSHRRFPVSSMQMGWLLTRGNFSNHRVPTPPGKSWIFSLKFQDLESPEKSLLSWKVLEIEV